MSTVHEMTGRVISLRELLKSDGDFWRLLQIQGMKTQHLAIADAAGKDSAAAVIYAVRNGMAEEILPVAICSGAEIRDWDAFSANMVRLQQQVKNLSGTMHDFIVLEDRRFWWSFCSRFTHLLVERFGFYSPCVGCHTVFHTMRSLLAHSGGIKLIISGEREAHDNMRKINQLPIALDSYQKICRHIGVTQVFPLRHIASEICVRSMLEFPWDRGKILPECALSGNYLSIDGTLLVNTDKVAIYYREFAVPAALEIIDGLLKDPYSHVESLLQTFLLRKV